MLPWSSSTGRMRKEDKDTRRGRKWKMDKCKWGLYRFLLVTFRDRLSLKTIQEFKLASAVLTLKRGNFGI